MVRAFVKRLRRKLGETAANPRYIFNEPRMGHRPGRDEGAVPAPRTASSPRPESAKL